MSKCIRSRVRVCKHFRTNLYEVGHVRDKIAYNSRACTYHHYAAIYRTAATRRIAVYWLMHALRRRRFRAMSASFIGKSSINACCSRETSRPTDVSQPQQSAVSRVEFTWHRLWDLHRPVVPGIVLYCGCVWRALTL